MEKKKTTLSLSVLKDVPALVDMGGGGEECSSFPDVLTEEDKTNAIENNELSDVDENTKFKESELNNLEDTKNFTSILTEVKKTTAIENNKLSNRFKNLKFKKTKLNKKTTLSLSSLSSLPALVEKEEKKRSCFPCL